MRALVHCCFILTTIALTACDGPTPSPQRNDSALQSQKMAFLHQIRGTDPNDPAFERALMNDDGDLGVILRKSVQIDHIPPLMSDLLAQMAVEFPDQDLAVIAYTDSAPPLRLGTARLDARSGETTYEPAR